MIDLAKRFLICAIATELIYLALGRLTKENAGVLLPFVIVFASPVWVYAFSPYLVDVLPSIRRKARRDALEPWNGRYYAYENHQVRLHLVDGVIWVPVDDLRLILDPLPDARELGYLAGEHALIPGQTYKGYTEAGLLRLLTTRTGTRRATHDMIRFKHWLETEAFPNLRRLPSSAT